MTTTTGTPETSAVRPYIDALRDRLSDLPVDQRAELLSDLEAHLAEVVADDVDAALTDRIGSPEAYVSELVASLGLDADKAESRSVAEVLSAGIRELTHNPVTAWVRQQWTDLKPAWWTIRGLALGLLVVWEFVRIGDPWTSDIGRTPGTLALIAIVVGSFRVGQREGQRSAWKWASRGLTVMGILAVLLFTTNLSNQLANYYNPPEFRDLYYDLDPAELENLIEEGLVNPIVVDESFGNPTVVARTLITPDVVGMSVGDAIDAGTAAGFAVEVDGFTDSGLVVSQSPAAGAAATEGVVLVISDGSLP